MINQGLLCVYPTWLNTMRMVLNTAIINVSIQKNQKASKGCHPKKATPKMGNTLKAIIKKIATGLAMWFNKNCQCLFSVNYLPLLLW
jgi:hypothetical protein